MNTSALAHLVPLLRVLGHTTFGYLHEVPSPREAGVLGTFWKRSNGIIAISDAVKFSFSTSLQPRIRVVYNCSEPVAQFPLPTAYPLKFLFLGRLTPRKGVREIVRCFSNLDPSRFELTVVGGPAPLGADIDMAQLRAEMDAHCIKYLGEISDPSGVIDSAHALIVPSLLPEGLGLTAIESLAHGRPVVATAVAGLTEVVDEEVGWLIDPADPDSWPLRLSELRLEDVVDRSERCQTKFEELFSTDAYRKAVQGVLYEWLPKPDR